MFAENERIQYDEKLNKSIVEIEQKEQKSKDERVPSDMELQEGIIFK